MNSIEEKLWNYIDGGCTPAGEKEIGDLIASDEAVRAKYQELLLLNAEFANMEVDEPPMAFTYNVMEAIRTEHAQQPLKAAINKKIIKGIGLFFVLTIAGLLIFALANMSFEGGGIAVKLSPAFKLPNIGGFITKPVVEGFVFFDTMLALFLLDKYLRRKTFKDKTGQAY